MSNLNKIFLMGRLTRDPELRYTPQGVAVSDLGLAVNREFTVNGERRKETLFIDVTVWRKQAEICCRYLKKGNPIFIEGRLSMDTWDGQDGQKRTRYRVIADNFQFIGPPSSGQSGGRSSGGSGMGEEPEQLPDEEPGALSEENLERNYGGNFRSGSQRGEALQTGSPREDAGGAEEDIPF
jgi:single-strand DNA-binding protein